jgi:hypothetical protein
LRWEILLFESEDRRLLSGAERVIDDGSVAVRRRHGAKQRLQHIGPIAPTLPVHRDHDTLDDRGSQAAILERNRRALRVGECVQLDVRL